ncbi:MAG: ATP-binding protein [Polyangiaceae bacterium]
MSFGQIFVNLFENASKYTPDGTAIDVSASRISSELVNIVVRDHGPGVPTELEEKLFEKFFRAAHQGASGAGLGLAICRGIAEAHGGAIRAKGAVGGGLEFHVTVPIGTAPPSTAENEAAIL